MIKRIRSASSLLVGLAMFAYAFMAGLLGGCQVESNMPRSTFDQGGATVNSPSPVILDSTDSSGRITSAGVGPSSFTSITADQIQTFRNGSVPRDIFFRKGADGTWQIGASAGDKVSASNVEIDPNNAVLKIGSIIADTAEPVRAQNEAFKDLVPNWNKLSDDNKAKFISEMETIKAAYPTMESIVSGIIKGLTGGIAP
ncbi:MAG: hypothetical protein K2Q20_06210 [Phycisphaerales bacterium]|nr:hypothetical protein [Phycisphaerales bacterium]